MLTSEFVKKLKQSIIRGKWGRRISHQSAFIEGRVPGCILNHADSLIGNSNLQPSNSWRTPKWWRDLKAFIEPTLLPKYTSIFVWNDNPRTSKWDVVATLGKAVRHFEALEKANVQNPI